MPRQKYISSQVSMWYRFHCLLNEEVQYSEFRMWFCKEIWLFSHHVNLKLRVKHGLCRKERTCMVVVLIANNVIEIPLLFAHPGSFDIFHQVSCYRPFISLQRERAERGAYPCPTLVSALNLQLRLPPTANHPLRLPSWVAPSHLLHCRAWTRRRQSLGAMHTT